MAHINTLYDNDLYDIFHLVLGKPPSTLKEWKKQLPFLQVCRKWYDMLYHYVYSRGFIDIYSKRRYYTLFDSIKDCVYYSNDEIVCRSNLGIITSRNEYNCKCVSSVRVDIHGGLKIPQYGLVLREMLNLGVGYWLNLTSLELVGIYGYDIPASDKKTLNQLISTARKHILELKSKAPNITRLHIELGEDLTPSYLFPILIEKYASRLQYLDCKYAIQRLPLIYSDELTHLTLNLLRMSYKLPKIYAKPLRHLDLRYVPGDFTWHCFHDGLTTGCIEFTNLENFKLVYQDQTDDQKAKSLEYSKRARPYGSYMLRFPNLSELTINNCPVDCDVLFTDTMPSHIKLLDITDYCDSIVAVRKLRFEKVDDLKVQIWGHDHTLSDGFYEAAKYYFGTISISSKCRLSVERLDIQRTGSWVNLTHIYLREIGFDDLLKLIPQLCNLQELELWHIHLGDNFTSITERGLEDEEQGRVEQLKTEITRISLFDVSFSNRDNLVGCINHLISRMLTVRIFGAISPYNYYNICESFLPAKFPHVEFSAD